MKSQCMQMSGHEAGVWVCFVRCCAPSAQNNAWNTVGTQHVFLVESVHIYTHITHRYIYLSAMGFIVNKCPTHGISYSFLLLLMVNWTISHPPGTREALWLSPRDDCQRTGWGRVGLQGNGSHERIKSIHSIREGWGSEDLDSDLRSDTNSLLVLLSSSPL